MITVSARWLQSANQTDPCPAAPRRSPAPASRSDTYGTGEEFDSSWSRADDETLPATRGAGQGPIPGGATLVFVIDLVDVQA